MTSERFASCKVAFRKLAFMRPQPDRFAPLRSNPSKTPSLRSLPCKSTPRNVSASIRRGADVPDRRFILMTPGSSGSGGGAGGGAAVDGVGRRGMAPCVLLCCHLRNNFISKCICNSYEVLTRSPPHQKIARGRWAPIHGSPPRAPHYLVLF